MVVILPLKLKVQLLRKKSSVKIIQHSMFVNKFGAKNIERVEPIELTNKSFKSTFPSDCFYL